jgi:hypothetical protein
MIGPPIEPPTSLMLSWAVPKKWQRPSHWRAEDRALHRAALGGVTAQIVMKLMKIVTAGFGDRGNDATHGRRIRHRAAGLHLDFDRISYKAFCRDLPLIRLVVKRRQY